MPTSFYSDALINVTIILLLHRRVPPATNALHFMIMEVVALKLLAKGRTFGFPHFSYSNSNVFLCILQHGETSRAARPTFVEDAYQPDTS